MATRLLGSSAARSQTFAHLTLFKQFFPWFLRRVFLLASLGPPFSPLSPLSSPFVLCDWKSSYQVPGGGSAAQAALKSILIIMVTSNGQ